MTFKSFSIQHVKQNHERLWMSMCPSRRLCAHAEVSGCCQPHIPAHYLSTWNSHRTQAYKNMNISEQNLQRLAQSFLGVLKRSPVIGFGLHSFRKSKALANTSATTETSRNLPFDIMWHHLTSSTLPCSAKPQYLPVFAVFCRWLMNDFVSWPWKSEIEVPAACQVAESLNWSRMP